MQQWLNLLGGLLLWTAHFFAVYIIGSVFPGMRIAAVLVVITTLAVLVIDAMLAIRLLRAPSLADGLQRWIDGISLLGYALAAVAIIYQCLPAILLQP
jgi:hypothetical protein